MMLQNNPIRVGDAVSFLLGGRPAEGYVVEDRGPLARGGKHLYRILVSPPSEDPVTFEMPEDQISLLHAQRTLLTEMARRVVQLWAQSPAGSLVDHLNGFQLLAKSVFSACKDISFSVRSECLTLARSLHFTDESELSEQGKSIATAQEWAMRLSSYAQQNGFGGLNEQIEIALWDSANRELERIIRIAQNQGWHQLEQALTHYEALDARFPLLLLLVCRPTEATR